MFYQQGDVLLKKVSIEFKDTDIIEKNKNGRVIVAEGEHTGHAHAIKESEAIIRVKDGKRYVITPTGFTITHEEHLPITVEPGIYEIGIVQEYDHFAEEARNVLD
jgi:hypothetical protein